MHAWMPRVDNVLDRRESLASGHARQRRRWSQRRHLVLHHGPIDETAPDDTGRSPPHSECEAR